MMETAAGIFIIDGAFGREILTRLAGLFIAIVMTGAIMMIHIKNGWNGVLRADQGVELQLFILAAAIYFLVKGNDVS